MGLFNLFKKPVIIEDSFFGKLRYLDFKGPSGGYFEGEGVFSPINQEIGYMIQADISGPTEEQKEFYRELQKNFNCYTEKIRPLVEDEFRNWKEGFEIQDFNNEFTLESLTIPRLDSLPLIWNMSFTTIHDRDHQVTIDFKDHEPVGILIDG